MTPAHVPHAQSVTAYDQYLLGRYAWNKRTPEGLRDGLACFQRAIDADPGYAPAYAGLADSHALLASSGVVVPHVAYPAARAAALRAIELDPSLAEGHASLGLVKLNYDWDWEGAERAFHRAIELNPSYSTARQWYSSFLSSMARHDEAIASAQQAVALDPLSITATIRLGMAYVYARRFELAVATLERAGDEPGISPGAQLARRRVSESGTARRRAPHCRRGVCHQWECAGLARIVGDCVSRDGARR